MRKTMLLACAALTAITPALADPPKGSGKAAAKASPPAPAKPAAAANPFAGTVAAADGLLPVHIDHAGVRILLTLPKPDADGVAGRFLYATQLRTGVGSADAGLDRGMAGETRLLAFRRIGRKIAIQYENPRFRATGAPAAEQQAARDSFLVTTAWMGDAVATLPDGQIVLDIAPFLATDVIGIGPILAEGDAKGFRLAAELSAADAQATKVFPDNIELEALQTFQSDTPGKTIENIAPDARRISFTVHHSLVRLPDAGFRPRRFDARGGTFSVQAVDFGLPLGGEVVYDLATHFRLEKTDPTAARSTVKKPIIFYIDRAAPEPIRTALAEGVAWWDDAFDAAGFIDAFQVKILPEGIDPMDVRYNVVNWVDRATRGWSYGQAIEDPRTGEIIKGSVILGALRVRQDILIYEGLVGTAGLNTGGPNDPVRVALARIRQLGAHEVGHALGFAHNFAGSTQDRASVMDYPAPRIGLKGGVPDLSDAYDVGIGTWDRYAVDWLYGAADDTAARAKADAAAKAGLRYVSDSDARGSDVGQPWGSLWDDGADPAAELTRMMGVRAAALGRFGTAALTAGEPMANLRRKLVPVWLLHRYQVDAAAKLLGGVDYAYAAAGDGREAALPVPAAMQRAALSALMGTLDPRVLTVPTRLVPMLSSGRQGSDDRQYDIEVFANAGGPVFDPLVATDSAASLTIDALLAPARLTRLMEQHAHDPNLPGAEEVLDRLTATAIDGPRDIVGQRIAWRTIVSLARASRDPAGSPEVRGLLDERFQDLAFRLEARREPWARSLARTLRDREALDALLASQRQVPKVPPGMPIGDAAEYMDLP